MTTVNGIVKFMKVIVALPAIVRIAYKQAKVEYQMGKIARMTIKSGAIKVNGKPFTLK